MNLLVSTILVTLPWTSKPYDHQKGNLLFLRKSSKLNKTLLSTWKENKLEVSDRELLIREVDLSSYDTSLRTLSENEMRNALEDSRKFLRRRRRRDSEDWMAINSSVDDIDHDSKEFNKSVCGRRSSQNVGYHNSDDGREPQNNRSDGQRVLQNVTQQNKNDRRLPQNVRRNNDGGHRATKHFRKQHGSCHRKPQNESAVSDHGRKRQTSKIFIPWSTYPIETTSMTPLKGHFRNKTTTETFMNKTTSSSTEMSTATPTTVQGYKGMKIIFPGTKWCGNGNIAKNYTDLGSAKDTDKCCRAHDGCKDFIAPGETRYNLTNTSSFYKFSCECDEKFYECLNNVNNIISHAVGKLYFNILQRDCYRKVHPQTKECKQYSTFSELECLEYETDTNAPPVYTWVPAQIYGKIPISPLISSLN